MQMVKDKRYKKLMSTMLSLMIIAIQILLYAYCWFAYYDTIIPEEYSFWRRGHWLVIAIYGILLLIISNVYGAYKIGYLRVMDVLFSQILSVVCVNIITWLQICLINRWIITPLPMLALTIWDVIVIILWIGGSTFLFRYLYPPRRLLLIHGERNPSFLADKVNARPDKYAIQEIIDIKEGFDVVQKKMHEYEGVVICDLPSHERNALLKYCFTNSIRCYMTPKLTDIIMMGSTSIHLFDTPLQLSRNKGLTPEQRFAKRIVDIAISLIVLILFSPVLLISAIAVKLYDGGPVLYKQDRLTLGGEVFQIYKFRSMRVDSEKHGARLAMKNDDRITPVGKILRTLHVDELPQLINILKGEMSFVGPRPERPEIAAKYEEEIPEFHFRLKVKAGLTGYAQVYGKYNTVPYDKLKLDLYYVQNYSVFLDFKLIMLTVKVLFQKDSTEGVDANQTTAIKNANGSDHKEN